MQPLQHLVLALLLTVAISPAITLAETDDKQPTQQKQNSNIGAMPTRGMSMDEVKQHFGQALQRFTPVGNPPITRWKYDGLMVYFEDQYVIDSVATDDNDQ